jgi:hypothetical protein
MATFRGLYGTFSTQAALAVAFVLAAAHPSAAQGRDERDRLALEARRLFRAIELNPTDVGPCTFDRTWEGRAVLAETAQRFLGVVVRADLVVSDPPASPMQVIDPETLRPETFCNPDERESARREAIAAFEGKRGAVLRFITIGYSFPVFNADYTRAALAVQRHAVSHRRGPDGTSKPAIEAQGGAEIYEKRGGTWQRIGYDSYYTAH